MQNILLWRDNKINSGITSRLNITLKDTSEQTLCIWSCGFFGCSTCWPKKLVSTVGFWLLDNAASSWSGMTSSSKFAGSKIVGHMRMEPYHACWRSFGPSFLQLWIRNIFWFWNIIKTGPGGYCQSQMPVQTGLDWMSFQQFIAHCAQSAEDSDPQLWWHIDSKLFLNGIAQQCPWCLLSNPDCQHFDNPDTLAQFKA